MDHQTPELIEKQMADTRESLTEKVATLEQQVVDKIQSATEAVHETVQTVRAAVEGTVESVAGSVKSSAESVSHAFDVPARVRETPWTMVGSAALAGFVTGLIVFRRPAGPSGTAPISPPTPFVSSAPTPTQSKADGWLDDVLNMAGKELKQLVQQAVVVATSSLKEAVVEGIPKLMEGRDSQSKQSSRSAESGHHGNGRPSYADAMD